MNTATIQSKAEKAKQRKIAAMVRTVARKAVMADFEAGLQRDYDYSSDEEIFAFVTRLFNDPAVRKMDIPRIAFSQYNK